MSPAAPAEHRDRVLVVEDEPNLRRVLAAMIERAGFHAVTANDGEDGLRRLDDSFAAVVTDLRMPKVDGMTLLKQARVRCPDVPVIMITAHGSVDNAVEVVKAGAFDYIEKPFEHDHLLQVIEKAVSTHDLASDDARVHELPAGADGRSRLVGDSPAIKQIYALVEKVASTPSTVLITGESGTGKELVAKALHEQSSRAERPFIKINCAAIPKTLMESELFGYEKGAFTGAVGSKPGRFELAHEGTLFLDEIGEIPVETQVKLLRVLQEREFERVGGIKTIKVDVRLITATNRDLEREIKAGSFREDLFYRLNVVPIHIPPLRERREDIPVLVRHFVAKFNERLERRIVDVDDAAMQRLLAYHWPGNIRELENVLERTIVLADGPVIRASDLPTELGQSAAAASAAQASAAAAVTGTGPHAAATPGQVPTGAGASSGPTPTGAASDDPRPHTGALKDAVRAETERVERALILRALEDTGGNVTQAARRLKISRKSLQIKMKELGLREKAG